MLGLDLRSPQRRATSSGSVNLNSPFVPSQVMQPALLESLNSSSKNCHNCIWPDPETNSSITTILINHFVIDVRSHLVIADLIIVLETFMRYVLIPPSEISLIGVISEVTDCRHEPYHYCT